MTAVPMAVSLGGLVHLISAAAQSPPAGAQVGAADAQPGSAPTITSANNATFVINYQGSFGGDSRPVRPTGDFEVTTSPGVPATPVTLSETGTLPTGVTFVDNGDGTATISDGPAPGTGGTYVVTITASNGVSQSTQTFILTVDEAPRITSSNGGDLALVEGVAVNFTVTTSPGFPASPVTLSSGGLPAGLTFHDNGDGTATLSGTPAFGTGSNVIPSHFTTLITASNGVASSTQVLHLPIFTAARITSANHATFTVGTESRFFVNGGGSFSESGALPTGVTFLGGPSGAVISGTPAAGTGGTYVVTITTSNGPYGVNTLVNRTTQTFTLTVNEAPTITSANHTSFTVKAAGTFTVTTHGFPTPKLTVTGTLPAGLTFTDHGNGTATISGTPAPRTVGTTHQVSITASNGVSPAATQAFTLAVAHKARHHGHGQ